MKKTIRILALALVLVMSLSLLASCGSRLSGTYKDALGLTEWEFKGSKLTISVFGQEIEAKYKIKGDEITITYSDDAIEALGIDEDDLTKTCSFEKDGDTIIIDGEKLQKKD